MSDLIDMPPEPPRGRDTFLEMLKDRNALEQWVRSKGPSWPSYQRLRAAEVTDDMARLVTRAAGFTEDSEEFIAIRYLVRSWRSSKYDSRMEDGKASIVAFLVEFDLMWSMRRIRFVLKKLNELASLDADAKKIAGVPRRQKESDVWPSAADEEEFLKAVSNIRTRLNDAYVYLRGKRRHLWAADEDNPFRGIISMLDISSNDLRAVIHESTDADRTNRAKDLLSRPLRDNAAALLREVRVTASERELTKADAIEELTNRVREELREVINEVRSMGSEALRPPQGDAGKTSPNWELFLRETLWYYYVHFDSFDQIAYPLLYSTGVGEEADVIDIFRVSPKDATALVDEEVKVKKGGIDTKVKKLAGTRLGNFGAFFERTFRVNDIMWGRLDGAERVIAALLPTDKALQKRMTEQAHRAIIVEEKMSEDAKADADLAMQRIVWDALDHWDDRARRDELLVRATGMLSQDSSFRKYLETLASGSDPIELFKQRFEKDYEVSRQFTQDATLKSAVRINRVLGGMARGYLPGENAETENAETENQQTRSKQSLKRKVALFIGERVLTFTEAAIQPDGPARRRQRWKIICAYFLSLVIIAVACWPAYVLLRSAATPWPALGFLGILIVTFVFAGLPLGLTIAYHYAWIRLKRKLDAVLPRARTQ